MEDRLRIMSLSRDMNDEGRVQCRQGTEDRDHDAMSNVYIRRQVA
jgi:hypothetical protein